jgi:hypothetical protein
MENVAQPESTSVQNLPEKGLSWKGIVQVFYEPTRLFEKLKENPRILVPWLVFFVLMCGFFLLVGDLITSTQMEIMQSRIERQGQMSMQQMPSYEQMKWSTVVGGPIVMMLGPLLASLLALFFGNIVMAGRATLKQILSVTLYGEIIYGVGALVVAPMMLAKDSLKVSLSLAAFFRDMTIDNPWYTLLSKFNVFYIWELVAIGIGLSIIYGFARNKGYLLAVLSMGLISLIHVLSGFLFS